MIYQPAEDSFLMENIVREKALGKKVLDMGSGSGIQAQAALEVGAKEVLAVDIDDQSIKHLKRKRIGALKSDLFSKVKGKFDLIIFNPPYLPSDSREDSESALATAGGKRGDEIILRFLKDAVKYLTASGEILLLVSSLTPMIRIDKLLKETYFKKKVVAKRKIFMEELVILEIRKT